MECTALVVLTTLHSDVDARRLVRGLLDARLVACGTVLPGAQSLYRWEGEVAEEPEVLVILKTDAAKWEALAAHVRQEHPYRVPELLALSVTQGMPAYLRWLADALA
jgi:periplasmic divalent cation tolerance protein